MEQKLNCFVKFHGALIALSALGSTMRWAPWTNTANDLARLEGGSAGSNYWTTGCQFVLFIMWSVKTICLIIGLMRENPTLVRTAKWLYLGTFVVQVVLLSTVLSIPGILAAMIIVLAIIMLYIYYVLHVLEHLFVELQRKRQGAILVTDITVCDGSTPQQEQQLLAAKITPSPTLQAATMQHPKADASQPDAAVKAKEFPSWE